MEERYTADQFCGIKSIEQRMWFVINELFKKEKHTIDEWIRLVAKHGIEVK